MTTQRDALLAARYRGVRTVEIDGRRVTYATDNEMAAAIVDLERRIALASTDGRRRRILRLTDRHQQRQNLNDKSAPRGLP